MVPLINVSIPTCLVCDSLSMANTLVARSKRSIVSMISENSLNIFWSVDNLLNEEYFDHMSRLKNLGIHEMGRNISVGLNYNF